MACFILPGIARGGVLLQLAQESCDGDQRAPEIVGNRVDEALQFGVLGLQIGNQPLALPLRSLRLLSEPLAFERRFDRWAQASQMLLDHVVGGPGLDAFDGRLFVDGPGDDDDGDRWSAFSRQLDGRHAIELREHVVRQDEIRRKLLESLEEGLSRLHAPRRESDLCLAEFGFGQLSIAGDVLQKQDVESVTHVCLRLRVWISARATSAAAASSERHLVQ